MADQQTETVLEEIRLEALVASRLATEETHPLSDLIAELGFEGQIL